MADDADLVTTGLLPVGEVSRIQDNVIISKGVIFVERQGREAWADIKVGRSDEMGLLFDIVKKTVSFDLGDYGFGNYDLSTFTVGFNALEHVTRKNI